MRDHSATKRPPFLFLSCPQYRVERMEFFHRLLDKLDWAIAGLIGAVVASWWHREDLTDRKIFRRGMLLPNDLTGPT